MAVRLRLQRHGRKKRPFYIIVAADSRVKRDGKYIERVGSYDPTTVPATIELNNDAALKWLQDGAEVTNTVKAILSYRGVMYKKHLMRGVAKGAFSMEEAETKWTEWMESREKAIIEKKESAAKEARASFEKVESEARDRREAERAEKAQARAKAEAAAKAPEAEAGEEAAEATDIDSVARQAAAERGEVVDQDTPAHEQMVDENPAANDATDVAQNTEEFQENEAKDVANTATTEEAVSETETTEETVAETETAEAEVETETTEAEAKDQDETTATNEAEATEETEATPTAEAEAAEETEAPAEGEDKAESEEEKKEENQ